LPAVGLPFYEAATRKGIGDRAASLEPLGPLGVEYSVTIARRALAGRLC
jgi:hypothetical protein